MTGEKLKAIQGSAGLRGPQLENVPATAPENGPDRPNDTEKISQIDGVDTTI